MTPNAPSSDGRTPRVAVAGWIGSTNLGDELIARAVCGRLTNLGAEPLAITIDPQRTAALLGAAGVEHHRIRDTPGLIRALRSVDGVVFGAEGWSRTRPDRSTCPSTWVVLAWGGCCAGRGPGSASGWAPSAAAPAASWCGA
ncbi:MAG: hypothetical protein IPH81_18435 [Candidatus Microthrix sp.]|nr:hypothetical protein [Candidatus Microthrix sp.]